MGKYLALAVAVSTFGLTGACDYGQSPAQTGAQPTPTASAANDEDNSRMVYEAVLLQKFPKKTPVTGKTNVGVLTREFSQDIAHTDLSPQLLESYKAANETSRTIQATQLLGSADYPLLSDASEQGSRPERRQTSTTSHGTVTFSGVGFIDDRSKALVSVSYLCGSLCGFGKFYMLVHSEQGWRVVWEREVWVA